MSPRLLSLAPSIIAVLAAGVAIKVKPKARFRSTAQHLAAGVVFAAVALELLPDLMQRREVVPTAIGFAVGVALLLGLRAFEKRSAKSSDAELSPSYVITIAVDLLIDGLVLGIGFAAGQSQGILLTIALSLEMLSLGLALASQALSTKWSSVKTLALVVGVSGVLPAGTFTGSLILPRLPPAAFTGVLAFGVAAMLYLATEELLVEAHEQPDTAFSAATFFVGFLAILVLDILIGSAVGK